MGFDFHIFLENWNICKNWKFVTCYIKTFMFTTLYCPNVSRSFILQLCDNGLFAFNCIPWLCDCCSAGDLVSFTDILVWKLLSPVKRGDTGFSFSVCPASCPGHISESTQWNFFMARLTVVRGPLCFCLVRPSVRQWGSIFLSFYGVLRRFGVFLKFSIFVLACVRACVTLYVLSFVVWTCPRVLVRSTWNLFRSPIYELKLCTFYFWSTSVRPFVRQNGRNIASHTGLLVIFFFNLVDWTCSRVLVQSTWNLFRSTVYELELCTSYFWSTPIRPSVCPSGRPEHSLRQHFSD